MTKKTKTKRAKFNWLVKLNGLVKRKVKPDKHSQEQKELERRSRHWPTCACGQLCKALPRGLVGDPLDHKLFLLGVQFDQQIIAQEYDLALITFRKIEARTAMLLREMNRKVVA